MAHLSLAKAGSLTVRYWKSTGYKLHLLLLVLFYGGFLAPWRISLCPISFCCHRLRNWCTL